MPLRSFKPCCTTAHSPFDVTTNWNQVKQLLGQDLPRTFLGQVTVAEAIDGLTPRLDVLMQQHQDNIRQAAARKG